MKHSLAMALGLGCFAGAASGEIVVTEQRLWEGVAGIVSAGEPNHESRGTNARPNRWTTGVTDPVLSLYRPDPATATGAACVVCPGGGYGGLAIDKEGHYVARWLAQRGVLGVVLPYRCGGGAHRFPVPQQDAQRAIRLVRSRAADWGVATGRVGVMGFSAGGHLAAITATGAGDALPRGVDPLEGVSARPDFAVLVYPVISMREGVTHGGSRRQLLGELPDQALIAATSADEQVSEATPPTLLIHSIDDRAVPVANAQRFYEACRAAGVPVELHLYETGGHGYGMWATEGSVAGWPDVLEAWLRGRDLAKAE